MFLLCHEDASGMEFGEPKTFFTKDDALEWDRDHPAKLYKGHAIVLYECRQVAILHEISEAERP